MQTTTIDKIEIVFVFIFILICVFGLPAKLVPPHTLVNSLQLYIMTTTEMMNATITSEEKKKIDNDENVDKKCNTEINRTYVCLYGTLFYNEMKEDVKQRVTPFALYYAMCSHVSFAL